MVVVLDVCFLFFPKKRIVYFSFAAPSPSNTADKNGNPTGNATDPVAEPENKTLYENLPFHGMQNPPNKVRNRQTFTHLVLTCLYAHTYIHNPFLFPWNEEKNT